MPTYLTKSNKQAGNTLANTPTYGKVSSAIQNSIMKHQIQNIPFHNVVGSFLTQRKSTIKSATYSHCREPHTITARECHLFVSQSWLENVTARECHSSDDKLSFSTKTVFSVSQSMSQYTALQLLFLSPEGLFNNLSLEGLFNHSGQDHE